MKRLLTLLGALVLAIAPIAGDLAHADPGGRGRGRGGDHGERYERRGGEGRGPGWARDRGERWQDRGRGGWGPPGQQRRFERGYDRGPDYDPPPRRGGYIGGRGGRVVDDYPRYRLRAPPRGFVWVRMGQGYGLVSQDTGQVFDVIPY